MAGGVRDRWPGAAGYPAQKVNRFCSTCVTFLVGSTPAVAQMWKLRDARREGAEPSTTLVTAMTSLVYARWSCCCH
jgi:hypothetical protein